MNSAAYLIFHRDHPIDPRGINSGAEMATLSLARFLARAGKSVYLCAQLKGGECKCDGVTFWDLGPLFDVKQALTRAQSLGAFHLISGGRALPLMLAKDDPNCLSRILISHDRASGDTGINPKIVSQVADYIFHVSDAQRQLFIKDGSDPKKSVVIHNGVDLELFKAGDPELREMRRLVFVGALVVDKGLHLLIRSFSKLITKYPDLKLDVYGSSSLWDREEYLNQDEITQALPGITFHGKVSQDKIADAFCKSGLCIIPSIWFDPFPLVSIDAQASGCPVVAFDVGGLKEGLVDGETGIIIPEISEEALTKVLDNLLSDPNKMKELSKSALSISRPRFTWEKLVQTTISHCETAARQRINQFNLDIPEKIEKKLGFLSTWNQECGLATYGRYLVSQFETGSYVVLAEQTEKRSLVNDEAFVIRCWQRESANFDRLESVIAEQDIGLLYLNCQYRFFQQPEFSKFILKIRLKGVQVIAHLHSTFTLDNSFSSLVCSVDHVIVHSKEARLEAIANGATPSNTSVIPHGVFIQEVPNIKRQTLRHELNILDHEKVILSFGFVQPHKGMQLLIEAINQLRKNGLPVKGIIAGTAALGDPNSNEYLAQLKRYAVELGLSNDIIFVNRFLEDQELGEYIAASDLVLMNYLSQHYEASGACSLAVGAGALVATSLAPSFHSFGDAVWHITAGYPVALSLATLLTKQDLQDDIKLNALRYSQENSWKKIGERLKNLFSSKGFVATKSEQKKVIQGERKDMDFSKSNLKVLMQNRSNTYLQRGGDTVVLERTKAGLEKRGVQVVVDLDGREDPKDYDLVHLFNFAIPDFVKYFGERAKAAGKPFVVTTLYEDIPSFHNQSVTIGHHLIQYVKGGQSRQWYIQNQPNLNNIEKSGYFDNTWAVQNAAVLLPNGTREADTIRRDYCDANRISIVPVGYDIGISADPDIFYREYGIKDFILCVGRLETRKNQLMLLKALEDSDIPIVFAAGGFSYQPEYENAVRSFRRRGKNIILGRLSPEMLASTYSAAKIHALPSWYELPGLVSLEAAYYGCNVVVSDRGTSKDYFGDKAFYCDPANEDSVRNAVLAAYQAPIKEGLKEVAMKHTWDETAEKTLEAYQVAIGGDAAQSTGTASTVRVYDLDSGVTEFQEVLERGEMAAKERHFEEAHLHLADAEQLNPNSARLLRARGAVYLAQEDVASARTYFERALKIEPTNAKLYSGLGMCEMQLKRPDRAYPLFVRALEIAPAELVAILQLVECSYATGQYVDLERVLRRYLVDHPIDIEMQYCLAGSLYKQDKLEESERIAREVLKVRSSHLGAQQLVAAIEENREKAITAKQQVVTQIVMPLEESVTEATLSPSTVVYDEVDAKISEAEECKRQRSYQEARKKAYAILSTPSIREDQKETATLLIAEVEVLGEEIERAEARYDEILIANPNCARAMCGKGAIAAHRGEWDKARDYFEKAQAIAPRYDVSKAGLGLFHYWKKDYQQAWDYFIEAININPENVRALLGVIELGYALKKYVEIEKAIKGYLDMHPADLQFSYSLAGCYFAQDMLREAMVELDKIQLFDPNHKHALELRGMINEKLGIQTSRV